MPAFSTHFIFAKELMPVLCENVDFAVDEDAVYAGAQGPDVFFFHRVMPWLFGKSLRRVGSKIHRAKPSLLFDAMRSCMLCNPNDDIIKSYFCGFIMHYALDRKCHPYVYYLQNKMTSKYPNMNSHTAHNTVEFATDSYLLNRRMGIENPASFETKSTLCLAEKQLFSVSKAICRIAQAAGCEVSQKQARTAFLDTIYIQKITLDKSGIKCKIISLAENAAAGLINNFKLTAMMRQNDVESAEKFANINHGSWKSPFDENARSRKSFEDLFDEAQGDALDMIKRFFRGDDSVSITHNISFLTGVEVE